MKGRLTVNSASGLKLLKGKKYVELLADKELTKKALNRLAELEDKIEDGMLVELPIPSGTELHFLHSHEHADRPISPTIHSTNKWSFEIWGNGKSGISSDDIPCGYYGVYHHKLGDTVFLTRAEAEKKLKELKGELK